MSSRFLLPLLAAGVVLGQYCNSGPTTTVDSNLGVISLRGKTKTIFETTGCPGTVGPGDYTYLVADVVPGFNYTISYQVITCGNVFPVLSGAWIDYNQNQQFDDWESLFPFNGNTLEITTNFTVVNDTNIRYGPTRLRVQVQETNQINLNPCATFPYGGTKDFTVEIIPEHPGYCNSGPTSSLDTQMGAVMLKGESSILFDNTSCTDLIGPINLTHIQTDLIIGNLYQINYTVITCGPQFPTTSAAWIDFNQNQVFDQWEQVFPYSQRFGAQAYGFKVPVSTSTEQVKLGITRMRLQVQETVSNNIDPCSMFTYGGTKDFGIEIKATIDGGWTDYGPCNASCGGGYQFRSCTNPPPSHEGAICAGNVTRPCNTGGCAASSSSGGKVAAGILVPLIIIGGIVGYYFYRKRKSSGELADDFSTEHASDSTPTGAQTGSYQTAI